jgi:hypothetical protein
MRGSKIFRNVGEFVPLRRHILADHSPLCRRIYANAVIKTQFSVTCFVSPSKEHDYPAVDHTEENLTGNISPCVLKFGTN